MKAVSTDSTARCLLSLSDQVVERDPVAAYLCAWIAFERLVRVTSAHAGVRAQFGLRKNGTVQTRQVGKLRMPVVVLPRPERQLSVALEHLSADVCDVFLRRPAVKAFADRVPTLNGRRLVHDAKGQGLSGVLDVAGTPDPRYPAWTPIDREQLTRYLDGEGDPPLSHDLLVQVATLLSTVRSNLLSVTDPGAGDNNVAVAREALPLLKALAEALMQQG